MPSGNAVTRYPRAKSVWVIAAKTAIVPKSSRVALMMRRYSVESVPRMRLSRVPATASASIQATTSAIENVT